MNKIHEECGVFGVYAKEKTTVASTTYYGLFALQHRGQESCGIVVNDDGVFQYHKDGGLVNDVFTPQVMQKLGEGNMALGHVRYGTTAASGNQRLDAQPMVINHIKGRMAVAHNGSIINSFELRQELELEGSIFHTTSDTEVISYIITKERLKAHSIEEAVNGAMGRIKGAYSLIVMSASKMIAARDPHGFHPLCYGVTPEGNYIIASETCALDAVGASFVRDILPGEIVIFDGDEIRTIQDHCGEEKQSTCIFEYIYFSRPDSVVDGKSVHAARVNAGACLALEHPVQADVVIGVPDSGLDAAIGYARQSGIPYGMGFIKNKYIGRTFIAPGQKAREDKVRIKLNVVSETVKGKRVVLVDDSIVRGTTSARIVKLLRDAGATEVHMRSSAPPFLYPCYYGTDVDSQKSLIAVNHTMDEIKDIIGVDSIGFLNLDHLGMLIGVPKCEGYCSACFDGQYPTEVPTQKYDTKFERKLSERGE